MTAKQLLFAQQARGRPAMSNGMDGMM